MVFFAPRSMIIFSEEWLTSTLKEWCLDARNIIIYQTQTTHSTESGKPKGRYIKIPKITTIMTKKLPQGDTNRLQGRLLVVIHWRDSGCG